MLRAYQQLPGSTEMRLIAQGAVVAELIAIAEAAALADSTLATIEEDESGAVRIIATFDHTPALGEG